MNQYTKNIEFGSLFLTLNQNNNEQILNLIKNPKLKDKVESLFEEEVFSMNITHNLNKMAESAGFYEQLWHLKNITTCEDLLPHIESGLVELQSNPDKYKQYSESNGWGTYEQFINWLKELIINLKLEPNAILSVSI